MLAPQTLYLTTQAPVVALAVLTALTHLSHEPQMPIEHSSSVSRVGPLLPQAGSVDNKTVFWFANRLLVASE